jgi:hypothetical protein
LKVVLNTINLNLYVQEKIIAVCVSVDIYWVLKVALNTINLNLYVQEKIIAVCVSVDIY